jgi:hypothetical protein
MDGCQSRRDPRHRCGKREPQRIALRGVDVNNYTTNDARAGLPGASRDGTPRARFRVASASEGVKKTDTSSSEMTAVQKRAPRFFWSTVPLQPSGGRSAQFSSRLRRRRSGAALRKPVVAGAIGDMHLAGAARGAETIATRPIPMRRQDVESDVGGIDPAGEALVQAAEPFFSPGLRFHEITPRELARLLCSYAGRVVS